MFKHLSSQGGGERPSTEASSTSLILFCHTQYHDKSVLISVVLSLLFLFSTFQMLPLMNWWHTWISWRCVSCLRWPLCFYWKVSEEASLLRATGSCLKNRKLCLIHVIWLSTAVKHLCEGGKWCHVSTIVSSAFGKHIPHTRAHTQSELFFLLPCPCDLSHVVWKKSTLTQQPIIVFQETQNEIGERTKKKIKEERRMFSVAHLSRPAFDKQHHTNSSPLQINEN